MSVRKIVNWAWKKMGTEVINVSFDVLQEELDKAKSTLKGLNDNIRRISGREPPEQLRLVYQI